MHWIIYHSISNLLSILYRMYKYRERNTSRTVFTRFRERFQRNSAPRKYLSMPLNMQLPVWKFPVRRLKSDTERRQAGQRSLPGPREKRNTSDGLEIHDRPTKRRLSKNSRAKSARVFRRRVSSLARFLLFLSLSLSLSLEIRDRLCFASVR